MSRALFESGRHVAYVELQLRDGLTDDASRVWVKWWDAVWSATGLNWRLLEALP